MKRVAAMKQAGFTLVEVAVTLVVLAIAVGYAIPGYQSLSADSAIRSTTMSLIATINEARTQALNYRVCATVTGSGSGWTLAYPDITTTGCPTTAPTGMTPATQSGRLGSSKDTIKVLDGSGNPVNSGITFMPNGFINVTAPVTLTVCDNRTNEIGRQITLQKNGKVDNANYQCS